MEWISRMVVTFLIDSMVQVAVIAGLALVCSWALRRAAARYQHVLWVAALLLSSLLPVWSLKSANFPAVRGENYHNTSALNQSRTGEVKANDSAASGTWARLLEFHILEPHIKEISVPSAVAAGFALCYAVFLIYRILGLAFAWRRVRNLYDAPSAQPASELVRTLVTERALKFHLKCAPRVYALDGIGPLTVGSRQPVLLMPATFLEAASRTDLDSAVCHELAHIARRDFQSNLICEFVSLAVSFHPAVWLMKSRVSQARELACDDLAAEKMRSPTLYAGALIHMAQSLLANTKGMSSGLAHGLFDTDHMERRVRNLLDHGKRLGRGWGRGLTWAAVGSMAGIAMAASAFSIQAASEATLRASSVGQGAQAKEDSGQPRIRVSQITFAETTKTIDEAEIRKFAKEIEGLKKLGESPESWLDEVEERTKALWQNHGYFKVKVEVRSKLESSSAGEQVFSVAARVDPGAQYKLKELVFTGGTVFTTAELRAMFPIVPGDIFSREMVARGLEKLRSNYGARGYKDSVFVPDTDYDDSNRTVTLKVGIEEGRPLE